MAAQGTLDLKSPKTKTGCRVSVDMKAPIYWSLFVATHVESPISARVPDKVNVFNNYSGPPDRFAGGGGRGWQYRRVLSAEKILGKVYDKAKSVTSQAFKCQGQLFAFKPGI